MARDYKLNKSELTKQKRQQKLYLQYLPVLRLKEEQLQVEYNRIRRAVSKHRVDTDETYEKLKPFLPCFPDIHAPDLSDLIEVSEIKTSSKSIAGVPIQVFREAVFKKWPYTTFFMPSWIYRSRPILEKYVAQTIQLSMLLKEANIIRKELKKATQKVNLFDMVLVPKTKEAIKRINIALGDEQVASVSRGKIAKRKRAEGQAHI